MGCDSLHEAQLSMGRGGVDLALCSVGPLRSMITSEREALETSGHIRPSRRQMLTIRVAPSLS